MPPVGLANTPSGLARDIRALLVEAVFGLITWAVIATAIPTGPGITTAIAWAYTVGGASVGALAALCGWLLGRRRRWALLLDLPIGGAFVTAALLAAFMGAFSWSYPIAPGVGRGAYFVQAVLGAVFGGLFGAMLGAVIGILAALPSYAVLRGLHKLKRRG